MAKFSQNSQKRVTQQDIADAVGVSHVTVSHVLHRSQRSRVSSEMQQQILRVAQEMGYQPRGLTTHTIGLVVEPQSIWWEPTASVISFADEILREHGFRATVTTLGVENFAQASKLFDQKKVDGVIFTEWQTGAAKYLKSLTVPWVLIADADEDAEQVDQVGMDTVETARRAAAHLIARGHRSFCVLTGLQGIGNHERMKQGIFDALEASGLPRDCAAIIHHDDERELEPELLALMRGENPPTAIIVSNPGGAIVVLNRFQQNGYRVPQDISIISLVDGPRLQSLKPKISATTALGREHIQQAINRLIIKITQPETIPHRVLLPGEIIERNSVCSIGTNPG